MKKLLLVALAAAAAVFAKKKIDEGKTSRPCGPRPPTPSTSPDRRRPPVTRAPRAPTTRGHGAIGSAPALQAGG